MNQINQTISVKGFNGPLDLLLRLVKEHEMDIFSVDLMVVIDQYLNYLKLVKYQDLDDAGAFLHMAGSLIELKIHRLIRKKPPASLNKDLDQKNHQLSDNDPQNLDQEQRFKKRLYDYQTFQNISEYFTNIQTNQSRYYRSYEHIRLQTIYQKDSSEKIKFNVVSLLLLYEDLLKSLADALEKQNFEKKFTHNIDNLIKKIATAIKKLDAIKLQDLYPVLSSRQNLIATIISILQLSNDQDYLIYQKHQKSSLWIYRNIDTSNNQKPNKIFENSNKQSALQAYHPSISQNTIDYAKNHQEYLNQIFK